MRARVEVMSVPRLAAAAFLLALQFLAACARPAAPTVSEPKARWDRATPGESFGELWDDGTRCNESMARGRRIDRPEDALRIGNWNIRWFPDGRPGTRPKLYSPTDLDWLVCVIVSAQFDALVLQEIKMTERGREAMDHIRESLLLMTGSKWGFERDACAQPDKQHLAILWREDRVDISHVETLGRLDPTEIEKPKNPACPGRKRPGFAAYVRPKGVEDGFHLMTVHLDSGREMSDFVNREAAWGRLPEVIKARLQRVPDDEVLVAGDFNTMGCRDCAAKDSETERAMLRSALQEQGTTLEVLPRNVECSEYYRGHGGLLDLVIGTGAMRRRAGEVTIGGLCGASECKDLSQDYPFFRRLSDHCPMWVDVQVDAWHNSKRPRRKRR